MCWNVLGYNRWFDPLAARKAHGPASRIVFFGHTSRKRRLDGIKFVLFEKFGGASQISILLWPDVRALVCEAEAGSDGGEYTLHVAGMEPSAPRPNWSADVHDR